MSLQRYLSRNKRPLSSDVNDDQAVQVKVNDENLFGSQRRGHICHCANCRKVAGGVGKPDYNAGITSLKPIPQILKQPFQRASTS
jgi:hypothetical protein